MFSLSLSLNKLPQVAMSHALQKEKLLCALDGAPTLSATQTSETQYYGHNGTRISCMRGLSNEKKKILKFLSSEI